MVQRKKINAKLSDKQIKKLKSAFKNQPWVTLRMNKKMFVGHKLNELIFATIQIKKFLQSL